MKYFLFFILTILALKKGYTQPKPVEVDNTLSNVNICLSGDCNNGISKMLRNPPYDNYSMLLQGIFKNGSLNGAGEVCYFDKEKQDTIFKYAGEFVDGLLISGTHYIYGHGISSASFEKDEGIFEGNILKEGTVTFYGYGKMIDGSYNILKNNTLAQCISGNCIEGTGELVNIDVRYYGSMFVKQVGKFTKGSFVSGNMVIDGYEYEPLKNGNYAVGKWELNPKSKNYMAKAIFKPKNYNEQIVGSWEAADTVNKYPFDISDKYFKKSNNEKLVSKETAPTWVKNTYLPFVNLQDSLVIHYASVMQINKTQATNENTIASNSCYMCHGTGYFDNWKFYMGKTILLRCPACHGYGKIYKPVNKRESLIPFKNDNFEVFNLHKN